MADEPNTPEPLHEVALDRTPPQQWERLEFAQSRPICAELLRRTHS